MAAFAFNFSGFKPDYKLFVSFVYMTLQLLFYKYADLNPINIGKI